MGDLTVGVLRVVHAIPGRVRLHVPALKGNRALARAACDELRAREAILEVRANPVTGSLTIHYDRHRAPTLGRFHQLIEPVQALFPDADGPSPTRPRLPLSPDAS
jgi:hypothetical protein